MKILALTFKLKLQSIFGHPLHPYPVCQSFFFFFLVKTVCAVNFTLFLIHSSFQQTKLTFTALREKYTSSTIIYNYVKKNTHTHSRLQGTINNQVNFTLDILGRDRLGSIRNKNIILEIYSSYSALGSRIAGMESKYSGMRIASKRTLTCIIPTILIPDSSQTNTPLRTDL